jgi:phosphotransferase system HPr (HPr) family protein
MVHGLGQKRTAEPQNFKYRMTKENQNKHRNVVITNDLGLHARSAAQIAHIAQNSIAKVWIEKDDEKADASSIIDILTLACAKETKITIIIEDPGDLPILDAIADLVDSGFGE